MIVEYSSNALQRNQNQQIRSTGNISTYISSPSGTKILFDQGFPVSLRYENAEVMREYLYAPQTVGLVKPGKSQPTSKPLCLQPATHVTVLVVTCSVNMLVTES